MEQPLENEPLAPEDVAGSRQVLVQPPGTTGASNSQALKIAAVTTLVCILLSAQAFTAYMVIDQKQQIHELQTSNDKLERQMFARPRVASHNMVMPMDSLPLMDVFNDEKEAETPKPAVTPPSVETQLRELTEDHQLPEMSPSVLTNLETLRRQITENDWKSFKSWLRFWMIFQKAQTPAPTPEPGSGHYVEEW